MGQLTSSIFKYLPVIKDGVGLATHALSNEASYREEGKAQKQALRNLQAQQKENMRQIQENAALDRASLAVQSQEAQRERQAALKRAVARQRAQFGASGVGAGSGSGEAVLLGLFSESEEERAARERLDGFRFGAIDQNIEQQRRLNVLQRTQLRERQKLNGLSSAVDRYGDYLETGLDTLQVYKNYKDIAGA